MEKEVSGGSLLMGKESVLRDFFAMEKRVGRSF